MSLSPHDQLFTSAFIAESAARSTSQESLEALVRQQLAAVSEAPAMAKEAPATPGPEDLVTAIGNYLAQTTQTLSCLTIELVQGQHMHEVAVQAHEIAWKERRMSDLTGIARMDARIEQLRRIRDLIEKLSHNVTELWQAALTGSPSNTRRSGGC
ncbi:hypothetical protein ACJZ2D_000405 [Fusarium nematophilum]